uniref:C2H2-type domain-containing protein n=1 Tax=Anopheles christyi TaxID=43041 RepID=A0A182K4R1_9DIPT
MACDDELFAYSANYIEPGEILFDADEMQKLFLAWDGSFNPPPPRYPDVSYQRKRGRRKLLLCELCGKTVVDITRHYENHSEPTYSCPHCPVKMKQKSNITNHVLQVHLRKPSRTCKICGIGFIHHKTYRYHMLTHEGEGKTFECKDCSKTFPNAIYLRDHFNRLHNIVKTVRKAEPGDKVRRTTQKKKQ